MKDLLLRFDEALLPGSGLDLERAIALLEECREVVLEAPVLRDVEWELEEAESDLRDAENELRAAEHQIDTLEAKVAKIERQLEELLQKMRGQA